MKNADLGKLLSSVLNAESATSARHRLESRFPEDSTEEKESILTYVEQDEVLWNYYHLSRKILVHLQEFEDSDLEIIQIMGEMLAASSAREQTLRG